MIADVTRLVTKVVTSLVAKLVTRIRSRGDQNVGRSVLVRPVRRVGPGSAHQVGQRRGDGPVSLLAGVQVDESGPGGRVAHPVHQLAEGGAGLGLPGTYTFRYIRSMHSTSNTTCSARTSATVRGNIITGSGRAGALGPTNRPTRFIHRTGTPVTV